MYRSGHMRFYGNCSLILVGLLFLAGCGDITGTDDESGSILNAMITPTYFEEFTKQVDALMDLCETEGEDPQVEKFTDHLATIVFTNRPWPNGEDQTASTVYLERYTITYAAARSGLPNLDATEFALQSTLEIPACLPDEEPCAGTSYDGFTFVDIGTKDEYLAKGGDPFVQGRYNVVYTFYGHNIFGKEVSFKGSSDFVILDYDYCDEAS